MNKEKIIWSITLFISLILFISSMITGNTIFSFISLLLAVVTYTKGDDILFKEYNQKRLKKQKQTLILKEASQTIIKDKFSKKIKGGDQ